MSNSCKNVPPDLNLLVGPALLESLLSWCLYGMLIVQLYIYFLGSFKDGYKVKFTGKVRIHLEKINHLVGTVYGLFAIDTWHTVAITSIAWSFLVSGWGDPNSLQFTGWGFALLPLISGLSSTWVQFFFAWRIYILGQGSYHFVWKIIVTIICTVSLAQGIAGAISGIKFLSINDIQKFNLIYGPAATWLAASAAADVMIAVSMVILLLSAKKRIKNLNTNTEAVLTRLIHLTVKTGAVTAITAVVDLGVFLGQPQTNLYLLMSLILGKLYTNTLYATLNSRAQSAHILNPGGSQLPVIHINHSTTTEVCDSDCNFNGAKVHLGLERSSAPLQTFSHHSSPGQNIVGRNGVQPVVNEENAADSVSTTVGGLEWR
ncbi:hypothetical protein BT96DRAFT_990691 [Gymnopus androsaceus JB14]|uniref:DUF6534 domain-containing protein n=1 Tax=Gymnopus androsaceus JB14 TaxID=1447944 RepID=A0A6A4I1F8_9AGAR|nr:hypothetical protein BT96DRAFT_990691 [Gymnopus androsaceus JB14]